jgi:hypothetical protein
MTQAFNLSQLANRVNTSGQLNAATGLFNQVPVANGGTGKSTVTTGALLLGAGTSAMTELTGTTAGTTIVASPTGWVSAPTASVAGGDYIMQRYTSPNVWTKPATLKAVKVTVVGGGGNGGNVTNSAPTNAAGAAGGGGGGGAAILYLDAPAIPGSPITITAGPGTNSFGSLASGTGGANAANKTSTPSPTVGGAGGTGTIPSPAPSGAVTFNGIPGLAFNTAGPGGGHGGSSQLFYALMLGTPTGANQNPGTNSPGTSNPFYGGGGSGAPNRVTPPGTSTGGTGGPGIVIIEEFY